MLVYIHVPFCARRCSYCDFAIAVRREVPSDRFADLILREWDRRQDLASWDRSSEADTVYFGGGTPSRLEPRVLGRILEGIAARRTMAERIEITLEANPDDVTDERASAWRAVGINRVSLGAQSFHGPTLEWMHRTHTAGQTADAVRALRRAGFQNLSLDLIYGVPGLLRRDWAADLDRAIALEPEHVSFYALTVEPATPLAKWTQRGAVRPSPDERVAAEFLEASDRLTAAGFDHYEVSNAARPHRRAIHNSAYWLRAPFVGLGPSAHSGAGRERWWNLREWEAYRRAVEAGDDPVAGRESLDDTQVLLERRYLGLRTDLGLSTALVPVQISTLWEQAGWAGVAGGTIRLTPEGWLRLDALVAALPDDPRLQA